MVDNLCNSSGYGLLYYFIMIVFQIPQYIYFFIKAFTMGQEISADPTSMFDWVYISLTTIGMVFQYLALCNNSYLFRFYLFQFKRKEKLYGNNGNNRFHWETGTINMRKSVFFFIFLLIVALGHCFTYFAGYHYATS